MEPQKEPTLEEYELDVSSYENYRKQKNQLEDSFLKYKEKAEIDNPDPFGETITLIFYIGGIFGSIISLIFGGFGTSLFVFGIIFILGLFFERMNSASLNKRCSIISSREIEINKEIEIIKNKIYPLEEACIKYYLHFYDEFYNNNLYRKHKNTEKYEKFSKIYSSILSEIIAISHKLIFEHKNLSSKLEFYKNWKISHILNYKNSKVHYFKTFDSISFSDKTENELRIYLENQTAKTNTTKVVLAQNTDYTKKIAELMFKENQIPIYDVVNNNKLVTSDNALSQKQDNKNKEGVNFWDNLMKDANAEIDKENNPASQINDITSTINKIPPDKKYYIPRKIDWENINKNKSITGLKGEEIVFEIEKNYLKSINKEDLAEKVKHMSLEGDGAGYDILSFFPDGREKYIEVKSSKNSSSNSFNISSNELDFMKRNQNNYHIYQVFNINENEEMPTLKVHRASDILEFKKITPVQYVVKME